MILDIRLFIFSFVSRKMRDLNRFLFIGIFKLRDVFNEMIFYCKVRFFIVINFVLYFFVFFNSVLNIFL